MEGVDPPSKIAPVSLGRSKGCFLSDRTYLGGGTLRLILYLIH